MPSCERAPCHLSRRRPALSAKKLLNSMKGICKGQESQLEGHRLSAETLAERGRERAGLPFPGTLGGGTVGQARSRTRWLVFESGLCLSSCVTPSQPLASLRLVAIPSPGSGEAAPSFPSGSILLSGYCVPGTVPGGEVLVGAGVFSVRRGRHSSQVTQIKVQGQLRSAQGRFWFSSSTGRGQGAKQV